MSNVLNEWTLNCIELRYFGVIQTTSTNQWTADGVLLGTCSLRVPLQCMLKPRGWKPNQRFVLFLKANDIVGWGGVITYMVRCLKCSCTWIKKRTCYTAASSLALAYIRHATLLLVLLHFPTSVMLHCCKFSCTSLHGSCHVATESEDLATRASLALALGDSTCHDLSQLTAGSFIKNKQWRKNVPGPVVSTNMRQKWDPEFETKNGDECTWMHMIAYMK